MIAHVPSGGRLPFTANNLSFSFRLCIDKGLSIWLFPLLFLLLSSLFFQQQKVFAFPLRVKSFLQTTVRFFLLSPIAQAFFTLSFPLLRLFFTFLIILDAVLPFLKNWIFRFIQAILKVLKKYSFMSILFFNKYFENGVYKYHHREGQVHTLLCYPQKI